MKTDEKGRPVTFDVLRNGQVAQVAPEFGRRARARLLDAGDALPAGGGAAASRRRRRQDVGDGVADQQPQPGAVPPRRAGHRRRPNGHVARRRPRRRPAALRARLREAPSRQRLQAPPQGSFFSAFSLFYWVLPSFFSNFFTVACSSFLFTWFYRVFFRTTSQSILQTSFYWVLPSLFSKYFYKFPFSLILPIFFPKYFTVACFNFLFYWVLPIFFSKHLTMACSSFLFTGFYRVFFRKTCSSFLFTFFTEFFFEILHNGSFDFPFYRILPICFEIHQNHLLKFPLNCIFLETLQNPSASSVFTGFYRVFFRNFK